MAIFGLLALMVPIALLAGVCEGIGAMYRRGKAKAEWRRIKRNCYPRRKVWMV